MVTSRGKRRPQIALYLMLAALTFIFVYPFWQTIVLSFSDKTFANAPGFKFWPREFTLDSYRQAFSGNTIFIGYLNTLFRAGAGTLITLLVTLSAAYAMTHKRLPGRAVISFLIVFTMYFGGGLVPTYLNLKTMGLLNTRWVLVLPMAAGAWNFIIMRNFIGALSPELEESAHVDGATPFQTLFCIIMPLSKAVIAVIALWSVVSHWNAWYDSMVYANQPDLVVLQMVVRRLIDQGEETAASGDAATLANSTTETMRCAVVMIATAPILAGYPFIQKYLVRGTMVGAVKG